MGERKGPSECSDEQQVISCSCAAHRTANTYPKVSVDSTGRAFFTSPLMTSPLCSHFYRLTAVCGPRFQCPSETYLFATIIHFPLSLSSRSVSVLSLSVELMEKIAAGVQTTLAEAFLPGGLSWQSSSQAASVAQ